MTKNTKEDRYNSPFGKSDLKSRAIASRTSVAKIVYYSYRKNNFGVPSNVRGEFPKADKFGIKDKASDQADPTSPIGVIEDAIANISISKSLRSASASFSISLLPTENWKRVLRPGDWIIIYLYANNDSPVFKNAQTDRKNIVLVGNIDRVSRVREKDEETDKVLLRYKVSGRNFGKVFEQTDLWFNPYAVQTKTLDTALRTAGLPLVGNPTEIVTKVIDIFLGPGSKTKLGATSPLEQWVIPEQLSKLFSEKQYKSLPSFYDILDRSYIETGLPGYKPNQMLQPGQGGNLWESMKRGSNGLINELFCEEVRDQDGNVSPSVVLRPRPYNTIYFDSQFGKKDLGVKKELKGKYKTLQDLSRESFIELAPQEVMYEDLGMDDHSRYNMVWLEARNSVNESITTYANLNLKGEGINLPLISTDSINRYGLRRFSGTLEFVYSEKATKVMNSTVNLYKAFLVQIYDFYYANHMYEQGTIETTGVLEAELGKCLKIPPEAEGEPPKIYYIEGYEHTFSFPSTWTTKFTVTRGQFDSHWRTTFIDADADDWGKTDKILEDSYLVKTKVPRKKDK
jgi:hypothetical protein